MVYSPFLSKKCLKTGLSFIFKDLIYSCDLHINFDNVLIFTGFSEEPIDNPGNYFVTIEKGKFIPSKDLSEFMKMFNSEVKEWEQNFWVVNEVPERLKEELFNEE